MAKPNYFSAFDLDALKQKEKAVKMGVSEEEVALSEMTYTGGWKVMTEMIEAITKELDQTVVAAMSAGQNFEDIGRTTVAVQITKDILKRIVEKATDARESVARNTKT